MNINKKRLDNIKIKTKEMKYNKGKTKIIESKKTQMKK